jgi:hypothetical protein
MTASAAELLGWDDIARRDLPWRNPGVSPPEQWFALSRAA